MYGINISSGRSSITRKPVNNGRGMWTFFQSLVNARARASAMPSMLRSVLLLRYSSRSLSCSVRLLDSKFNFLSSLNRLPTTPTAREASSTCTTDLSYSGAILIAVCARLVVAPPISSGTLQPWRFIS